MNLIYLIAPILATINLKLTNLQQIYYSVQVLSQGKTYNAIVDTGSSTFWLNNNIYDCNNNTCVLKPNSETQIEYGIGKVVGDYTNIELELQGKNITISLFLVKYIENLDDFMGDGLIGLSKPQDNEISLIDELFNQKMIEKKAFALQLNEQICEMNSELVIGGYDNRHYVDEMKFVPSTSDQLWQIVLKKIEIVFNQEIKTMPIQIKYILIDSGTTKITLPKYEFQSLLRTLNEQFQLNCGTIQHNGINQIECEYHLFPKIEIILMNLTLTLLPKDYVSYCDYNYLLQKKCYLDFQEMDGQEIVLGVIFMQKYYTYFDIEDNQVGFALSSTYNQNITEINESKNQYNYSALYSAVIVMIILLFIVYVAARFFIYHSIQLYQSVLEKSSSRSQEQDHEMITLKTQSMPALT